MAQAASEPHVAQVDKPAVPQVSKPRPPSRHQQLNKLYALPAPLRTFPLPTFVPHNPLSLFHILYVWVSQSLKPQTSHFDDLYRGLFSPGTRSVHVTDVRSIRGLWEQGFYGKGTLSRSEPSWANREKKRRGEKTQASSEDNTRKRRANRQQTKWERARKEREAIDQKILEEAALAHPEIAVPSASEEGMTIVDEKPLIDAINNVAVEAEPDVIMHVEARRSSRVEPILTSLQEAAIPIKLLNLENQAPTGPFELLALPNSHHDLDLLLHRPHLNISIEQSKDAISTFVPPVGPLELLALPNSIVDAVDDTLSQADFGPIEDEISTPLASRAVAPLANTYGHDVSEVKSLSMNGHAKLEDTDIVGGSETNEDTVDESVHSEETTETNDTPSNGSVLIPSRPSTPKMVRQKSVRFSPTVEQNTFIATEPPSPERAASDTISLPDLPKQAVEVRDQEHLQLTLEEAFFLSYALGAISVFEPETHAVIPNQDLFYLFRKTSYFPPQSNPTLSPDDPFMINYVTYHHFRSLGWVVRSGIKFSADYMLYNRGPVFSHAEFAVLILPSYSDSYWTSTPALERYSKEKQQRTWAWMSCINRVITQVKKTLILTYVDIPKPLTIAEEQALGIHRVLSRYQVKEVVMNRFAANRMRD